MPTQKRRRINCNIVAISESSVYRNLEALESAGLIRSSMVKWVRRYELGDALAPITTISRAPLAKGNRFLIRQNSKKLSKMQPTMPATS